jgi:hypothetical protein
MPRASSFVSASYCSGVPAHLRGSHSDKPPSSSLPPIFFEIAGNMAEDGIKASMLRLANEIAEL